MIIKSIKAIEDEFKVLASDELSKCINEYAQDERKGVQKIVAKYRKKQENLEKERTEWALRMSFDEVFDVHEALIGVDEVGRGPLAGPVVAAAVILPKGIELLGLKDSKKMSAQKREELAKEIREVALAIGIGIIEPEVIDSINILQATFEAMRQAISQIELPYNCILVDGNKEIPEVDKKQHAIISGDNKSASIAAASVIAKVTRDHIMDEYAKIYKGYDWESNKGYGSEAHYRAIRKLGITPIHRKTFLKSEGIS